MKNKFILFLTYLLSFVMIAISILAIYVFFIFKSLSKRTSVQMNIGDVKQITMTDYNCNTNKIIITDKREIKSILYLIGEMEKTKVCFASRKTLIIKGNKGEERFGIHNNCLKGAKGQYICDINIQKFITDVYGKQ